MYPVLLGIMIRLDYHSLRITIMYVGVDYFVSLNVSNMARFLCNLILLLGSLNYMASLALCQPRSGASIRRVSHL